VLLVGISFLLSRNMAPYLLLSLLFLHLFLTGWVWSSRVAIVYFVLITLAFGRLIATHHYDTSVHINVANNLYARIFPDPQATALFHEKYSMPVGPFVEECKGANVTIPCFDGMETFRTNHTTQNYELAIDDAYGFADWIKSEGQRSYLRYLLFDSPRKTFLNYKTAFETHYRAKEFRFLTSYLAYTWHDHQGPNNLDILTSSNLGKEVGFFGFDSLQALKSVLVGFGFARVEVVLGYVVGGFVLKLLSQYKSYLSLSLSLLVSSQGLFFLSLFGDGMEIVRHVFPAIVLFTLSGMLFMLSLIDIFLWHVKPGIRFMVWNYLGTRRRPIRGQV